MTIVEYHTQLIERRELIEIIAPSSSVGGAPRSMNMGNIASPRRYDEGLCASTDAPRLSNRRMTSGSRTSGQQQRAGLGVRSCSRAAPNQRV
jgi:hypothetical protein